MSSPANDPFLAAWCQNARQPVTLAEITFDQPSALTIRAATAEVQLPDGVLFEAGLAADPIRARVDRLGTGPNPADTSIQLADREFAGLGATARAATDNWKWQGANVKLYLWDRSLTAPAVVAAVTVTGGVTATRAAGSFIADGIAAGTPVSAWAPGFTPGTVVQTVVSATVVTLSIAATNGGPLSMTFTPSYKFQVMEGVVDSYSVKDLQLVLTVLQPRWFNKPIPPVIDKITYPNSPDATQGQSKPFIFGEFGAFGMRTPNVSPFANKSLQEDSGAGLGVVPMILVDPGTGPANVKLLAAGLKCNDILNRATGHSLFMAAGDVLAPLDTAGITESFGATESYVTINDDALIAYYGIRPIDVRTTGGSPNTATNPKRAMDVFDETTFAQIDQGSGPPHATLALSLPTPPDFGYIEAVDAILCSSGDPANPTQATVAVTISTGTTATRGGGSFIVDGVIAGMGVSGTNVPFGTYVVTVFSATVVILSQSIANGANTLTFAHALRVRPYDIAGTGGIFFGGSTAFAGPLNSVNPQVTVGTWDTNFWNRPNRFNENTLHAGPIDLVVDFTGGTTFKAKVYWVALRVKYRPTRNLVTAEHGVPGHVIVDIQGRRTGKVPPRVSAVATYQLDAAFFGNIQGVLDDAAGTYAGDVIKLRNGGTYASPANLMDWTAQNGHDGWYKLPSIAVGDIVSHDVELPGYFVADGSTVSSITLNLGRLFFSTNTLHIDPLDASILLFRPSRLIQKPCDIVLYLLATYGTGSTYETGAGAFGSFVDARAKFRNATDQEFNLAVWAGQPTSVQGLIQAIADQSLSCYYIDRFSGKWLAHLWVNGAQPDFRVLFDRTDCQDLFECGMTSDVDLTQGVRVKWGFDHFKGRTLFETQVTATGSSQGYNVPLQRDQQQVITAGVNDAFDWTSGGYGGSTATFAETLAPGTYAPIDLAAVLQGKFRFRIATRDTYCGWGFSIKAGFNDNAEWKVSGVNYQATLRPGDYTPDGACIELARAMSVAVGVDGGYSASYSHVTGEVTIVSNWSALFTMLTKQTAISSPSTLCWATFGFLNNATVTPAYGKEPRYADRHWIMIEVNTGDTFGSLGVKWLTGASQATNCADVLGYSRIDQGNNQHMWANYARGNREAICAQSQTDFGPRNDKVIDAPWVRDEFSAQQLRDRTFDFGARPRAWVRFRTHRAPDMQRMRVIGFSADMDSRVGFPRYGSDGSWAGKTFRVIEVEQGLGPSYHTEIYAEEA